MSTNLWGKWPLVPLEALVPKPAHSLDTTTYAFSDAWKIAARYERFAGTHPLWVKDAIGTTHQYPSPGRVHFYAFGQWHQLQALAVPNSDSLLVVFSDATTGKTTHPDGRYLWLHAVPESGVRFTLDFNAAENAPCISASKVMCLVAPEVNALALYVTAGAMSDRFARVD